VPFKKKEEKKFRIYRCHPVFMCRCFLKFWMAFLEGASTFFDPLRYLTKQENSKLNGI
jgi:hypothetical protein